MVAEHVVVHRGHRFSSGSAFAHFWVTLRGQAGATSGPMDDIVQSDDNESTDSDSHGDGNIGKEGRATNPWSGGHEPLSRCALSMRPPVEQSDVRPRLTAETAPMPGTSMMPAGVPGAVEESHSRSYQQVPADATLHNNKKLLNDSIAAPCGS